MRYEVIEIYRVRGVEQNYIKREHVWSGQGKISDVCCDWGRKRVNLHYDSQHHIISFEYPFNSIKSHGDIVVVQYSFTLEDTSQENKPLLQKKVSHPIDVLEMEVILKHQDNHEDAQASYSPNSVNREMVPGTDIEAVPFDVPTKSFRYVFKNPKLNHAYRITW